MYCEAVESVPDGTIRGGSQLFELLAVLGLEPNLFLGVALLLLLLELE